MVLGALAVQILARRASALLRAGALDGSRAESLFDGRLPGIVRKHQHALAGRLLDCAHSPDAMPRKRVIVRWKMKVCVWQSALLS